MSAESLTQRSSAELSQLSATDVYPQSITAEENATFFLGRRGAAKFLGCLTQDSSMLGQLSGQTTTVSPTGGEHSVSLLAGPANAANATALRKLLSF